MKFFASVVSVVVLIASPFAQQVSFDRLLRADREPQNWLSYSGTVFNQRHSLLTQVTTANVKNLELQWVWQARSLEKFEATALAVDGVLYTLQGPPVQGRYQVVALDARSGDLLWKIALGGQVNSGPMTYSVNGKQFVTIAAGNSLFAFALRQ